MKSKLISGFIAYLLIFLSPALFAQNKNNRIQLNQLGFYPNATKIAMLTKEVNEKFNWNAPLVYLANTIEALQFVVGYSK